MAEFSEEELGKNVAEWKRLDRDPETIAELSTLSHSDLLQRFSTRIAFGTAGLRAPMRVGPSSLNSLVILQASQGLARYVKDNVEGALERGVVVGCDHRYRSKRFKELTEGVFRREGFRVYGLEGLVHTPMVPYTMTQTNAAVGVMITASHNPALDNGYKVYYSNAVQIIPPHDDGIAARIEESLEVDEAAWNPVKGDEWSGTEEMKARYLKMVSFLSLHSSENATTPLSFTYTPLHGVGLPFASSAFSSLGFKEESWNVVPEQKDPDPSFPTVKFPNPEEKGALDLAIRHADKVGSQIILANDPDADRFCAAEKTNGKWRIFTGDQLGTLLGSWVLSRYRNSGQPIDKLAMCASTVSSKMLATIAKKEGFVFRETLTGFKYLGNEALELEREGLRCEFAYEEAIGYMCGRQIRDKDGVTALVSFCELAASLTRKGMSVAGYLEELYETYGYFRTANSYFVSREKEVTDRIFKKIRYGNADAQWSALNYPKTLANFEINHIRDLTLGYDSSNPPTMKPLLPVDPKTHMISFELGSTESGDGVAVTGTVRTSGTEPKIKYYLEASGKDRELVETKLEKVRKAIGEEWLCWEESGLEQP